MPIVRLSPPLFRSPKWISLPRLIQISDYMMKLPAAIQKEMNIGLIVVAMTVVLSSLRRKKTISSRRRLFFPFYEHNNLFFLNWKNTISASPWEPSNLTFYWHWCSESIDSQNMRRNVCFSSLLQFPECKCYSIQVGWKATSNWKFKKI